MARLIRITYSHVTPESAKDGEELESGWIDEEGRDMDPNGYDDEGVTAVVKTVNFLQRCGATESSSGLWHPGIWYSTEYQTIDFRTGTDESLSFHLSGFTEVEEREIFAAITGRNV